MGRSATTRWIDGATRLLVGGTAVAAACVALLGTGLRVHGASAPTRFREAMLVYDAQHWTQAFAQLSAAADSGDASAARVAAMMARHGPTLFGQRFDVSPERLRRWDLATQGGGVAGGVAQASDVAQLRGAAMAAEARITR